MTPIGPAFSVKTVGVTFVPDYPDNLLDLLKMTCDAAAWSREPIAAVLIRNPQNEHDPNAVQVHVPALGDRGFVGHLPAAIAARLAPEIDAGVEWACHVDAVLVVPSKPEQPGIQLRLRRIGKRGEEA